MTKHVHCFDYAYKQIEGYKVYRICEKCCFCLVTQSYNLESFLEVFAERS